MTKGNYPDLYFTKEQLMLSADETATIAKDIFGHSPQATNITDLDRAFVQRALLIVVDLSEKTGMVFDVFSSFVSKMPSRSVTAIVKSLAKKTARRWFNKYIDDTPKYSAVGRSGFIYSSPMATEWKLRTAINDTGMLTSYLLS